MKVSLIFFSLGIVSASFLASLPELKYLLFLNAALFVVSVVFLSIERFKFIRPILWASFACALGFSYGVYAGYQALDNRLTIDLQERELVVRGFIIGLPQFDDRQQKFQLLVKHAASIQEFEAQRFKRSLKFPQKISISLYEISNINREKIEPGDYWQFRVKVKRPRTMVNPNGFDYELAQMRRSIGANAYVKNGEENIRLEQPQENYFSVLEYLIHVDRLRFHFRNWLSNNNNITQASLLTALLIGDTSSIEKDQWKLFNKTGTLHLIAISGLHLGFFAIVGFFMGRIFGRCLGIFWHQCNSYFVGHICAMLFVVTYSFLAGLNIPTLRTLIMLLVVQLAWLLKRKMSSLHIWLIALVAVLLLDPFSAYDKGFWLSFIAVGLLIFYFSGRFQFSENHQWRNKVYLTLTEFIKSQWLMLIGLLIPLGLLSSQVSLISPIANLVAIPLITFFVVPCLILASALHLISDGAAAIFLKGADFGAKLFQDWLVLVLHWNDSIIAGKLVGLPFLISGAGIPVALLSIFLMLLPKGLRNIWLGGAGLLLSFCIPAAPNVPLQVLTFDVGQGTAVLVKTPNHILLYDTGPKFSENFDAGAGIIQPYLQSHGVQHLDALVVSHNDQDHSGGLISLLNVFSVGQLYLGQLNLKQNLHIDSEIKSIERMDSCHQEKKWQWDQVTFEFINYEIVSEKSNNQSCVLLVTYADQKILLTGDIEKPAENRLLAYEQLHSIRVLFAPHHGSHTSSSSGFVNFVQPKYVVYTAGYHNQHGHPHQDIQDRYREQGAIAFNTAFTGALEFTWQSSQQLEINAFRNTHDRYWYWDDVGDFGMN